MSQVHAAQIDRAMRVLGRALQHELALGRRLLSIANAQTDALRENDAVRVESLEAEERVLASQMLSADGQRAEAARHLARALGIDLPPDDAAPPLSDIVLHAPLPESRRLLALRAEILATEQALQKAIARNRALLENALGFVRFSLAAMTGALLQPSRYGSNPNAVAAPVFYLDQKC